MPKISICIDVPNMEKATHFYTQAIGLELIIKKVEYTELKADDITVYLKEQEEGTNSLTQETATRNYKRHWTPIHLDFTVSNLDLCVSEIIKLGGVIEGKKSGEWGAVAFCADPFGNGFCIMQYNH